MPTDKGDFSTPSTEAVHFGQLKSGPAREMTFGEKAVGLTFNPGGHHAVDSIKRSCAGVIDQLHAAREETTSGDKKRMYSEAIRAIQTGQMWAVWAVKAATWNY